MEKIVNMKHDAIIEIKEAKTKEDLEQIRLKYLSKKGSVSLLMGELRHLPNEERPAFGQQVNM